MPPDSTNLSEDMASSPNAVLNADERRLFSAEIAAQSDPGPSPAESWNMAVKAMLDKTAQENPKLHRKLQHRLINLFDVLGVNLPAVR